MTVFFRRWLCPIAIAVMSVFAGVFVGMPSESTTSAGRTVDISDASGVRLEHFFHRLPITTNSRLTPSMHGTLIDPPCKQKQSVIAQISDALGFGGVVYAQPPPCESKQCKGSFNWCGSVRVTSLRCSDCGSGNGSVWHFDWMNISIGFHDRGTYLCGSSDCGCNLNECSCMGE